MEKTDKKVEQNEVQNLNEEMVSYLELNEEEAQIFEQVKSVLITKCELLEFEALDKDKGQDYVQIITYIKNKRLFIEDDGVLVKLRKPLKNEKGEILTDQVKILYERNIAREQQFTKGKKIKQGDISLQRDYSKAVLAASLASIERGDKMIMLSPSSISEKYVHDKDYAVMMSCYNLFRS